MAQRKVDDSIRMPNGKPSGLNSIGAGWGGEKPVKKIKSTKVIPLMVRARMDKKGLISVKKRK